MKTYKKLIEELMETSPVNSMGGGFSVGQASSNSGNLAGYDPVMGMHRRKKKKLKETFAGCPVFEVSSDDFTKCSHGRNRYERWGKKMNMEESGNQDIRAYAHRNPGKPIIIKDSTYGTMSYLIPRQNVNESLGGPGGPSRDMSPNDMYASGLRTKAILKKLEKKKNKEMGTKKLKLGPKPNLKLHDDIEYEGPEYDGGEREHELYASEMASRAETKKGKPLTPEERKHHEDKAYHDIGYRDGQGSQMEKEAGRKLSYKEMKAAKAKTPKHKIPLGSAGNPQPLPKRNPKK